MRQLLNHEVNEISGGSYFEPTLTETLTDTAMAAGSHGVNYFVGELIGTGIRGSLGFECAPATDLVKSAVAFTLGYGLTALGLKVYHDPEILNR